MHEMSCLEYVNLTLNTFASRKANDFEILEDVYTIADSLIS